jgi:hypothetical protein
MATVKAGAFCVLTVHRAVVVVVHPVKSEALAFP